MRVLQSLNRHFAPDNNSLEHTVSQQVANSNMPKPKSLTLFHFTKTVESWLGFDTTPNVAIPVVCFCDIPLSRISDHIGFYGNFGIGLTKEWAMSNGLNPLLYVSSTSSFTTPFSEVMSAVTDIDRPLRKNRRKILLAAFVTSSRSQSRLRALCSWGTIQCRRSFIRIRNGGYELY